ncbi:MAG: acetoacetate--CoA ligase, partial [Alphaproteobacteria bacterium]
MQYLVIAMDGADEGAPARRLAVREAHLANAKTLKENGNMLEGGAILDEPAEPARTRTRHARERKLIMAAADEQPIWTPSKERIAQCNLTAFMREAEKRHGVTLPDYDAVYNWSVDAPEDFWNLLWDFTGIVGEKGKTVITDADKMPGAKFFPEARLNFAENLLRRRDETPAMIFWCEDWVEKRRHVSWNALYDETARIAQALKAAGVGKGDKVAGFLPNIPEAVSAFLAAASLGAIWTSCSPDFGVDGVLDRFGQTTPKVIFATDGYRFNGKDHDTVAKLAGIVDQLDCVEKVVIVPYLADAPDISSVRGAATLEDFIAPYAPGEIDFLALPFDHPIYILYSSGTTGKPKCIVHAAGGVLMQHLKEQKVLFDIKPGDRMFYFTTLTWMMWNWLVTNLAAEATLMLYEGSPTCPGPEILFDYAAEEKITVFGLSAKFIDGVNKAGLVPIETHDLSSVKTIMSTGSPLVEESYDYVYTKVIKDVQLSSASGGTDLAACFVGGNPIGPIWRGEIQAPT